MLDSMKALTGNKNNIDTSIIDTKFVAINQVCFNNVDFEGYNSKQSKVILYGLMKGLDVQKYLCTDYSYEQMVAIVCGLETGNDITSMCNLKYSIEGMLCILDGITYGIDITKNIDWSASLYYPDWQPNWKLILECDLEKCKNPSYIYPYEYYKSKGYISAQDEMYITSAINIGCDVCYLLDEGVYKYIKVILDGFKYNINLIEYAKRGYDEEQLYSILSAIRVGMDVSIITNDKCRYNHLQMNEIINGYKSGIDWTIYLNPLFDSTQMYFIRLGLEAGIDVHSYANINILPEDMERMLYKFINS